MNYVKLGPIVKSVDVKRTRDEAFAIFVNDIARWWPLAHTRAKDSTGEKTVAIVIEAKVGGRIYETLNTGETRDWGEVLHIEIGRRLVMSFQMGRPKAASGDVEILFEPLDAHSCRVVLTHSHWERLGDQAAAMHAAFDRGWDDVFLGGFASFADIGPH